MAISANEIELMQLDILEYFEWKYSIPKMPRINGYGFDNDAYYPLYYSDKRYNLIRGGRGSAKSYEVCGKLPIVFISCLPFCRFLIMRQIYQTHKTSTFQELCDYIEFWQLQDEFIINKSPISIIHKESGNFILFRGMDKPNAIKSVKDVTHVVWEEGFEITDEKGFSIVDKSIRTPKLIIGGCHKHYIPFNPDNMNHWLYEKFYDANEEKQRKYKAYRDNTLFLKTTYRDNKFAHPSFIALIEADKTANPERYLVDGLGEWGRLKETGLFYRYFDYAASVEYNLKKRVYNSNHPLHITFDFNVYPYVSLEVTQMFFNEQTAELEVCTIDEICLTDKDHVGDVQKTVREFLRRYKDHKGKVFVCGDRAGHSRKTNAIPDFATIFNMLQVTPKSKWQKQRDSRGLIVEINPYPDYEQMGCTFKVEDNTIHSQNPSLIVRQAFFERLHQKRLKVLPIGREFGTVNSSGDKRPLSAQYPNVTIVQKIDEECKFLITDYQELKEDIVKGGKSNRNPDLGHTSDAMDYQYCQLFDAELRNIARELKIKT